MSSIASSSPLPVAPPASVPASVSTSVRLSPALYVLVFAALSIVVGVIWDISWHSTVGRDTFWTSAHMAIYLGGVLGGCCGGWLCLRATWFGGADERAAAVNFWGVRGPLGACICVWGALAMILSGPFDDWWHNAYGLDVKIISPPHVILATGMYSIALGALLLVLSAQNRCENKANAPGRHLFIIAAGIYLSMVATFSTEFTYPNLQHTSRFYQVSCIAFPILLVAAARSARVSWPATRVALVYFLVVAAMAWILPLFRGTPKLAPIMNPLTHMSAPPFPLLLFVPALAIDLALLRYQRRSWWRDCLVAGALGVVFLATLWPTQWFFAKFLISPAAENWFFAGGGFFSYGARPGSWQHQFWNVESTGPISMTAGRMVFAVALAVVSARLGLLVGHWLARVKR